ncbi:MAG: hypothetical protein MMC33_000877 [Icmadophila ericetorum]|nr:hypothetical protein [Icmadophila ericetorum]
MSLNGLDAPKVNEAYQTALGQPGGWFLLKYVSRDEVELLKEGNGGFLEAKETIAAFEEKSPLFGLTQYRRKKVLLKYIPDGTSRVLQVRLTVHFQSIVEKFSHDAVVAFTTAPELSETTLSSIISLRTSGSLKSSNSSLRRRRLTEIAEVSSETPNQVTPSEGPAALERNNGGSGTVVDQPEAPKNIPKPQPELIVPTGRPRTTSNSSQRNLDKSLPAIPKEDTDSVPTNGANDIRLRPSEDAGRPSFEQRPSFQSTRPSTRDSEDGYSYRPKVRLGPRPSLDYGSRSSSTTSQFPRRIESRPISTLPAGIRMPQRKPVPSRPQSQQVNNRPQTAERQQAFQLPQRTSSMQAPSTSERPPSKASSVASVTTFTYVPEPKHCTINTEKQRLMKALQLRQRKLAAKRVVEEASSQEQFGPTTAKEEPIIDMDHEAALGALDAGAYANGDVDIVHLGTRDLNANQGNSPMSIPEPSDPSSTQTSSVADVEEPNLDHHLQIIGAGDSTEVVNGTKVQVQDVIIRTELPVAPSQTSDQEPRLPDSTNPSISSLEVPSLISLSSLLNSIRLPSSGKIDPAEESTLARDVLSPNENRLTHEVPSLSETIPHEAPAPEDIPLPPVEAEDLKSPEVESNNSTQSLSVPQASSENENKSADHKPSLKVPKETEGQTRTRPSTSDSNLSRDYTRKTKRRGLVEPIRIVSTADNSEDHYLSDDSFMEELQSATVQEAKPISVSRSPITSVFPRSPRSSPMLSSPKGEDGQEFNRMDTKTPDQSLESMTERMTPDLPRAHRTVSAPLSAGDSPSKTHLSPRDFSGGSYRSTSGSSTPTGQPENGPVQIAKKVGLSTGISQRIKALEKFTSNPATQTSAIQPSTVISPAIVSKRKTSIGTPLLAPSPPEANGWSFRKRNPYPTPSPSPQLNTARRKAPPAEILSPTPMSKSKPQAITVTARIIRDTPNEVPEIPLDPSEPVVMNLHHSPLKVEHLPSSLQVPVASPLQPSLPSSVASNSSSSPDTKRDTLLSPIKSPRRSSISSRHSVTSRKGSDSDANKALSETSDIESTTGSTAEKRESKRSRLFKRMSTISSASRRSIVLALNPGLKEETPLKEEESIIEHSEPEKRVTTSMEIGDVNIQFPDTLLWRRRYMKTDEQGFLVLSPPNSDDHSRITTKRYHFSSFRMPYIPDQDRQELPNSVILDFNDSSTLQVACENSNSQSVVFDALLNAYHLHNQ